MTRRYLVIYQSGPNHWSASVPDVPGCGSIGHSLEELREKVHDELALYLERMAVAGRPIQDPFMGLDDVGPSIHAEWMLVKTRPVEQPLSLNDKIIQRLSKLLGPKWNLFSRGAKGVGARRNFV
jgi:predicted RNase H-like HicB family nuclease